MQDLTVVCGQCGAEVPVTESLAAPLLEASKREFERKLAEKNLELREQAAEMDKRREILEQAEAAIDATVEHRLKSASVSLANDIEKKVKSRMEAELASKVEALSDAEKLLKSRTDSLREANEAAASLRKEKNALEEEKLRLAAEVEDKVGEELRKARARYDKEYQADLAKKLLAKDDELAKARLEIQAEFEDIAKHKRIESEKELRKQSKALEDAKKELVL